MRFTQSWLALGAIVTGMVLPASGSARSTVEDRLENLERLVQGQISLSTPQRVEELQQLVLELRGITEEQANEIQLLNDRQEKLYSDLDKRLSAISGTTDIAQQESTVNLASEKQEYDSAYNLLEKRNYDAAQTEFENLLWKYPQGQFAPNAYYWLGEIYLSKWKDEESSVGYLNQAIESFSMVTDKFAEHHKAIDALLKLGLIEIDKGNWQAAKQHLTKLKDEYPESSRASIAKAKLQRLKQEGRI